VAIQHKSAARFFENAPSVVNGVATIYAPRPSGVVSGDVLVMIVQATGANSSISAPEGFSQVAAGDAGSHKASVFVKVAGASEPTSYAVSAALDGGGSDIVGVILAYSGVRVSQPFGATAVTPQPGTGSSFHAIPSPALTTTRANSYVIQAFMATVPSSFGGAPYIIVPPESTTRSSSAAEGGFIDAALTVIDSFRPTVDPVSSVVGTPSFGSFTSYITFTLELLAENVAPNQPLLTTLVNGESIDRAATNRAAHVFSDPDMGDSQSAFKPRHRIVGAAAWTTLPVVELPVPYYEYEPLSLALGDYERQVRTADAQGVFGPWSASGFFTVADLPPGITFVSPVNGETIGASQVTVSVSYSEGSVEYRAVADNSGAPNELVVLHAGGSTTERFFTLSGLVNSTPIHIQARNIVNALAGPWSSIRTPVAFTPPSPALGSVVAAGYALQLTMVRPARAQGEPATSYLNAHVTALTDGDRYRPKGVRIRIGTLLQPGVFLDYAVASGVDYGYEIESVADNGTTSMSALITTDTGVGVIAVDPFESTFAATY